MKSNENQINFNLVNNMILLIICKNEELSKK